MQRTSCNDGSISISNCLIIRIFLLEMLENALKMRVKISLLVGKRKNYINTSK